MAHPSDRDRLDRSRGGVVKKCPQAKKKLAIQGGRRPKQLQAEHRCSSQSGVNVTFGPRHVRAIKVLSSSCAGVKCRDP